MGFAINTNNDAINTYKNLNMVQNSLSKSLEKLSSGLRINQAGDDAAGLTISTQLGSQVSGLQQASRNAQDGTSLVQTADGALTQAQSILGRLRDLAVQAGNDSNSPSARAAITNEATSLTDELSRIGNSVNFNGTNLLDGKTPTFKFQVGADGNAASQISVDLSGANLVGVAKSLTTGGAGQQFTTADVAGQTVTFKSDKASTNTSTTVSVAVPASSTASTATSLSKAQDAVNSLNGDKNFSSAFSANVYLASGSGSSAVYTVAVSAKDGGTVTGSTPTGTANAAVDKTGAAAAGVGALQFDSADNAQATINALDVQIAAVSKARANIGAVENRFTNVVSTIATSVTNLTAAKSRITDVDMAQEMVNFTRANVLSQAGTAMLSQANSLPQLALKLLG